eukprot:753784-Hanusia_phi.AAC.3
MTSEQIRRHHEALTRIEVSLSQVGASVLTGLTDVRQALKSLENDQTTCEALDAQVTQENELRHQVLHKIESCRNFLESPDNSNPSDQMYLQDLKSSLQRDIDVLTCKLQAKSNHCKGEEAVSKISSEENLHSELVAKLQRAEDEKLEVSLRLEHIQYACNEHESAMKTLEEETKASQDRLVSVLCHVEEESDTWGARRSERLLRRGSRKRFKRARGICSRSSARGRCTWQRFEGLGASCRSGLLAWNQMHTA